MLTQNFSPLFHKVRSLLQTQPAEVKTMLENDSDNHVAFRLKLITQFYPPDFAATGQFMDELAQNLTKQGVAVQVFTAQPGYAFEQGKAADREWMGQVWVERSNFLRGASRQWAGRTITSLAFCAHTVWHLLQRKNRSDILLLTSEPPFLQVVGLLMHWLFQTRFVTLIYDLYPEVAIELGVLSENHLLIKFWQAVNKKVWHNAEAIVVPCQTMKDRVVKHCPELADKITVIHNWADPTWIKPIAKTDNPFVQEHDLLDKFVVLYSGNMGRCHDMDTILEAAMMLQGEPIEFLFIGGGPKQESVMQRIQELRLKNCQFLPYQDRSVLPLSLTACDLSLVSVDIGMEGLVAPSKFYSALSAGRPVAIICEPHSYLRSLVSDASCGVAVRNGDSQGLAGFIRHLAQDRIMAYRMGNSGHRYIAEYFTPAQISQQYFRILYRAVGHQADVYRSIKRGDFQVVYQLISDLGCPKIWGVEASIRWQHPTRGLICPAELSAVMAEMDLDLSLNWWFLGEVCRQIQRWRTTNQVQNLIVSINLNRQTFTHPDLITQLDTLLDLYQIDPACLQMEIDDASAMADAAATTTAILQLQARNIKVCISQIGATYLSLDYIHRFTIDTIKIAPSVISRIEFDPEAVNFLETIMTIAYDLGMQLIAQNINSGNILQRLREIGIQYGQGTQLFPAVSATEMSLLLMTQSEQVMPSSFLSNDPVNTIVPMKTKTSTVLVADDDRSIRSIIRNILQKVGCQVLEADNGNRAMELFYERQPDLILLDAQMPGLDGLSCCQQMQASYSHDSSMAVATKQIPILLITALDNPESIDAAFTAGATDYITKPVNWQILQQRISRLLS